MIEPAPLCSQRRRTQDLAELEVVATMYIELQLPMDSTACENFERLVDMAGTREFIPAICRIRQHLLNLKWSREGIYGLGYIVPVKHLNMSVATSNTNTINSNYTHHVGVNNNNSVNNGHVDQTTLHRMKNASPADKKYVYEQLKNSSNNHNSMNIINSNNNNNNNNMNTHSALSNMISPSEAEETTASTLEEFRKLQMLSKIKSEKEMMRRILPGVEMNLDLLGGDMIARAHSEYM